jgi:hypothetical protein
MCNDIRRLIAVYVISIPIERYLSGVSESSGDFTQDLLNDLFSILFYYEMASKVKFLRGDSLSKKIVKSSTLLVVNEYLTHRGVTPGKFAMAMGLTLASRYVIGPMMDKLKSKGLDLAKFEDSLETVVVLSLANNSIYDTTAKAISLLLFHVAFKW